MLELLVLISWKGYALRPSSHSPCLPSTHPALSTLSMDPPGVERLLRRSTMLRCCGAAGLCRGGAVSFSQHSYIGYVWVWSSCSSEHEFTLEIFFTELNITNFHIKLYTAVHLINCIWVLFTLLSVMKKLLQLVKNFHIYSNTQVDVFHISYTKKTDNV